MLALCWHNMPVHYANYYASIFDAGLISTVSYYYEFERLLTHIITSCTLAHELHSSYSSINIINYLYGLCTIIHFIRNASQLATCKVILAMQLTNLKYIRQLTLQVASQLATCKFYRMQLALASQQLASQLVSQQF